MSHQKQDLFSHDLSKEIVRLLRHNQTLQRKHDGAILFYKIKFLLRDRYPEVLHWSDDRWISCLAKGGGPKRRYQYCALNSAEGSGAIIYLRAIQGHSGQAFIDPSYIHTRGNCHNVGLLPQRMMPMM